VTGDDFKSTGYADITIESTGLLDMEHKKYRLQARKETIQSIPEDKCE
jgi:hypothetical protein